MADEPQNFPPGFPTENPKGDTPPTPQNGEPNAQKPAPPPLPPGVDRVEDAGVFQMLWDCKYCNTKKLLGVTHKFCPNCGSAQDTSARYFPSDEEAIALEDHEYTGADKQCGNCGNPNAAKAEFCTQCGSPLKEAKTVSLRSEQVAGAEGFATDSKANAKQDFTQQKSGLPSEPPPAPKSKKWWYISGGAAAAALVTVVSLFFMTRTADVRVENHSWTKTVKIEAFKPRAESSWCDSKPFDAYGVTQRREVRSYNKVADGETCTTARVDRGDGSFKKEKRCTTKYKDVPVYAQKCYYSVNRWGYERDIQSRGGLSDTPMWPALNIRAGSCLGCEREGGRSEAFVLHLVEVQKADKKHNCSYDEAKWRSIPDKAVKKIQVRLLGGAKCDTLQ